MCGRSDHLECIGAFRSWVARAFARLSHSIFLTLKGIPARNTRVADVWRHAMSSGTLKWFNAQKGFGFIQPDDGSKDVFVHISAVERAGIGNLAEGQKLRYEAQPGERGRISAENLQVA